MRPRSLLVTMLVGIAFLPAGMARAQTPSVPPGMAWLPSSPVDPGSTAAFSNVSCVSDRFCMAVGSVSQNTETYKGSRTLAERYDGSAWTIVPTIDPGQNDRFGQREDRLTSVSCASEVFCIAVGGHYAQGAPQGLVEIFDGAHWVLSTPAAPVSGSCCTQMTLQGVSCAPDSFCMIVGSIAMYGNDRVMRSYALAETYEPATGWSVSLLEPKDCRVLSSGGPCASLSDVSCPTRAFCAAVGFVEPHQSGGAETAQPIAAVFDANEGWSDSNPLGSGDYSKLRGISCSSNRFCMAVGDSLSHSATLAETFDGSSWTVTTAIDPGSVLGNEFLDVSCTATSQCVAVGSFRTPLMFANVNQGAVLTETWSNSHWMLSRPLSKDPLGPHIFGISCASDLFCMSSGADVSTDRTSDSPIAEISLV